MIEPVLENCQYRNAMDPETTNEIKQRIRMVRQLVDTEDVPTHVEPKRQRGSQMKGQMDTGSILSFTFGFILFLLLAVGIYAFKNLYHAIVKRFSAGRVD